MSDRCGYCNEDILEVGPSNLLVVSTQDALAAIGTPIANFAIVLGHTECLQRAGGKS